MQERIALILKIHPGEGRLLAALVSIMLLPAWFILMGIVNLLNLLLVTGLVQRLDRARLYRSLPMLLAAALAIAGLLLRLHLRWFYPVLYIGEGVINALQAVFLWGLAGSLLNTRQAKRLFPLFSSGGIAGSVLGSFSTPLLVGWFGAEAMPLVWSLGLLIAWLRACAIFASQEVPDTTIRAHLLHLAETDPDGWVHQTDVQALSKGETMDTLPTLTAMERILFLRRVPLFAGLEPMDLKQVAEISLERFYTDGEVIAHQGDSGDDLYIIVSGAVRVHDTSRGELAMRGPGEYVGEMAILDKLPRMASLSASGDTHLLCINQKDFETILQQRPAISLEVIHILSERLRKSQLSKTP